MSQSISSLLKTASLINNQWVKGDAAKTLDVENPADRSVIGSLVPLSEKQLTHAIDVAGEAFGAWSKQNANKRSEVLWRWYSLIQANEEELAKVMTLEQGKPVKEAVGEVRYAASYIKWFAEQCVRNTGDVVSTDARQKRLVQFQPIGVCGLITPWNFPVAMLARKVAAAIAAGCTVVAKPSEMTPFTALAFADLAVEAGLPPGVFNCVVADGAMTGKVFCASDVIRKLSFTGSTRVGKLLMQQSADRLHKLSLELGGNAPAIVFADADLQLAAEGIMAAKFRNNGQTCICINRLYVQQPVYDEMIALLKEKVEKLRIGDGFAEGVDVGPLVNQAGVDKFLRHRADALAAGAELVCEASLPADLKNGYFVQPCLLSGGRQDMLFCREETFAPLLAVIPFDSEDQAVALANDSAAGLASYLFTRDLGRAMSVADRLEVGMVGVNEAAISNAAAPFGGVKDSGFGREGSEYGLQDYQQIKYTLLSY